MRFFQMTSANSAKLEAFRTKIEERKACEKRAFDTCLQLIDADQVDPATLLSAVNTQIGAFD